MRTKPTTQPPVDTTLVWGSLLTFQRPPSVGLYTVQIVLWPSIQQSWTIECVSFKVGHFKGMAIRESQFLGR